MTFESVFGTLYLTYAITTIFLPKIPLAFELSGLYPLEVICALASIILFLSGRLRLSSTVKAYLAYMTLCLISWMPGAIFTDEPNWKSLILIFRYSAFILLIPIGQHFRFYFTESRLRLLLTSQLAFVAVTAGYVLYHMAIHPLNIVLLSGLYLQEYRLIGFTGHVFDNGAIREIGHTSVQMGVFVSILALIQLSVGLTLRRTRDFVAFGILVLGTSLTYSRSGMIVLLAGLAYLGIIRSELRNRTLLIMLIVAPLILTLLQFSESWDILSSYGTFGKMFSKGMQDSKRLTYWGLGIDYLFSHPQNFVLGSGYGTLVSILGFGTLESLFFDTFFESGIFALIFLMIFFHRLWKSSAPPPLGREFSYFDAVMLGIHISVPGLLLACAVGGNSLQTDFIAPALFLTIGICSGHRDRLAECGAAVTAKKGLPPS